MTRRRLTREEIDLWHRVADQTERLHPTAKVVAPARLLPKPKPVKPPLPRINGFSLGQSALHNLPGHNLKPTLVDHLSAAPLRMDRKAFTRMKRGKLRPEGRIDLHGLTLDKAPVGAGIRQKAGSGDNRQGKTRRPARPDTGALRGYQTSDATMAFDATSSASCSTDQPCPHQPRRCRRALCLSAPGSLGPGTPDPKTVA